jgi:hypothetical protein
MYVLTYCGQVALAIKAVWSAAARRRKGIEGELCAEALRARLTEAAGSADWWCHVTLSGSLWQGEQPQGPGAEGGSLPTEANPGGQYWVAPTAPRQRGGGSRGEAFVIGSSEDDDDDDESEEGETDDEEYAVYARRGY